MKYKIALEVDGLDLDDDETAEAIGAAMSDLAWSTMSGRTLATLFVEDPHPVLRATDAARRIRYAFPHVYVQRVDRDLVTVADIAVRASVTPEAVRLWASGERGPGTFPTPSGSVGGGRRSPSKVWQWSDVNAWLDNHYRLGDGYKYLDDRQVALLLDRLTASIDEQLVPTVASYGYVPTDVVN